MSKTINTVRRPTRGITAALWDVFDAAKGEITPAHVRELAEAQAINIRLAQSHLRQWKRATTSGRRTRRAS